MVFQFEITEDDYVEFYLDYASNSIAVKKEVARNRILLLVLYIILALFILLLFIDSLFILLCIFAVIVPIIVYQLIVYNKTYQRKLIKNVRKLLSSGSADRTLGKKEILINDDKITYSSDGSVSEFEISKIKYIKQTKHLILLYRDEISAILIKKEAINDINEMNNIIENISGKIHKSI